MRTAPNANGLGKRRSSPGADGPKRRRRNANGLGKNSPGVCRRSVGRGCGRLDRARPAHARRSSSPRRNKPPPPPLASSPSPRPGTMASSPRTAVARSDAECAVREAKTSCRVGPSAKDRVKTRCAGTTRRRIIFFFFFTVRRFSSGKAEGGRMFFGDGARQALVFGKKERRLGKSLLYLDPSKKGGDCFLHSGGTSPRGTSQGKTLIRKIFLARRTVFGQRRKVFLA